MVLNQLDKSNYLRGLLILFKMNKPFNESDQQVIIYVSRILGFNRDFVLKAYDELYENEHLLGDPPKFSEHKLAESFLKDAVQIAFERLILSVNKVHWLNNFVILNSLPKELLINEIEKLINNERNPQNRSMEIENVMISLTEAS